MYSVNQTHIIGIAYYQYEEWRFALSMQQRTAMSYVYPITM